MGMEVEELRGDTVQTRDEICVLSWSGRGVAEWFGL